MLGPRRRRPCAVARSARRSAGVFVVAVALNFMYFYPILTDHLLTNQQWNDRMWLAHWI